MQKADKKDLKKISDHFLIRLTEFIDLGDIDIPAKKSNMAIEFVHTFSQMSMSLKVSAFVAKFLKDSAVTDT